MAKKKQFHFTFGIFIRLLIFFCIIYFSIIYFSNQNKKIDIQSIDTTLAIDEETKNTLLPQFFQNIYNKLPENSRYQIEHIKENQTVISIQNQLNGFPGRQIKELQKLIVKNISDNIIKNIEEN